MDYFVTGRMKVVVYDGGAMEYGLGDFEPWLQETTHGSAATTRASSSTASAGRLRTGAR